MRKYEKASSRNNGLTDQIAEFRNTVKVLNSNKKTAEWAGELESLALGNTQCEITPCAISKPGE